MATDLAKLIALKKLTDSVTAKKDLTIREKFVKYSKRAFDLGWTAHSTKLVCAVLKNHANTIQDPVIKQKLIDGCDFTLLHPEWCYEDIFEFFNSKAVGWYPDPAFAKELVKAFENIPFAKTQVKKFLQPLYPDIKEEEW